jgi:hypothetical protein
MTDSAHCQSTLASSPFCSLAPLYEYFSVIFEFDLLTRFIQLSSLNKNISPHFQFEQLKHSLLPRIKHFLSFCLEHTTRSLVDFVPYQQLLWILEPSLSSISMEQHQQQPPSDSGGYQLQGRVMKRFLLERNIKYLSLCSFFSITQSENSKHHLDLAY